MTEKQEIGKKGEELAKQYLIKHNYSILETNWRFGSLEIDLIAENEEVLIFCEVKTRKSALFASPADAVTLQKQKNIIRAANSYVMRKNIVKEVRFDIISILYQSQDVEIQHIPDAFIPKW